MTAKPTPKLSVDAFFAGRPTSRAIFEALRAAVATLDEVDLRVSKSQIAFRRRVGFAAVWMPEQYLGRGVPLVLTVGLRRRDESARWKQVVEPHPGRFTHHLEIASPEEVDEQVLRWLQEAWQTAG